jgi:hypothetical protein
MPSLGNGKRPAVCIQCLLPLAEEIERVAVRNRNLDTNALREGLWRGLGKIECRDSFLLGRERESAN